MLKTKKKFSTSSFFFYVFAMLILDWIWIVYLLYGALWNCYYQYCLIQTKWLIVKTVVRLTGNRNILSCSPIQFEATFAGSSLQLCFIKYNILVCNNTSLAKQLGGRLRDILELAALCRKLPDGQSASADCRIHSRDYLLSERQE